jgi:N-carbamoyl-L-amino-acid hydrolase
VLERCGKTVGVVTGIQGKRTFSVTVSGAQAHAGTTPRAERRDALLAATAMIGALDREFHDPADLIRFTVGRLTVQPNAPSVVPALARFSIDLRHPDSGTLQRLGDRVGPLCAAHASPCSVEVTELSSAMSLEFPEFMRALIEQKAQQLGIPSMPLISNAGHDARYLHGICPSAMIFIPCKDGISHNEAESATPADLFDGARVLAEALVHLATQPVSQPESGHGGIS